MNENTAPRSDSERKRRLPTKYGDLDDSGLREELRRHMDDQSWTIGHLVEWDDRGQTITETDPELHQVLTAVWERLSASFRELTRPFAEGIAAQMAQAQTQLEASVRALAGSVDLKHLLPSIDLLEVLRPPELSWEGAVTSASTHPGMVSYLGDVPTGDVLEELAQDYAEAEEEVRQAHLQTARAAVAQLDALESLRQEVKKAGRRDHIFWIQFSAAIVAALAACVAVFLTLQ